MQGDLRWRRAGTTVPLLIGAASVVVSGWMIVTLPSGGTIAAGWRHELICSVLAVFAIYAATWAQARPWPQPAALVATGALALVAAALFFPGPKLPVLSVVAVLIAAGAVAVMPSEARRARGRSMALEAIVVFALADLAAITPVFVLLTLTGALR